MSKSYKELLFDFNELCKDYGLAITRYNELAEKFNRLLNESKWYTERYIALFEEHENLKVKYKHLKKRISCRDPKTKDSKVGRPALTNSLKEQIYICLIQGLSYRQIAKILGVSKSVVAKYGNPANSDFLNFKQGYFSIFSHRPSEI